MVKLRKFVSYRRIERPYTRVSKFKKKAYIKAKPASKIIRFEMGNLQKTDFEYKLVLKSKRDLQIRHNAIESARQSSNKLLEEKLGKTNYRFKIRIFPHHVLRENPLASGAGADRMSTGMKCSFGKTIGVAARIKKGQEMFEIETNKNGLTLARAALRRVAQKLPCSCTIGMEKRNIAV